MKNGEEIIEIICRRLAFKQKEATGHNILRELRELDEFQIQQLVTFGQVAEWKKELDEFIKNQKL